MIISWMLCHFIYNVSTKAPSLTWTKADQLLWPHVSITAQSHYLNMCWPNFRNPYIHTASKPLPQQMLTKFYESIYASHYQWDYHHGCDICKQKWNWVLLCQTELIMLLYDTSLYTLIACPLFDRLIGWETMHANLDKPPHLPMNRSLHWFSNAANSIWVDMDLQYIISNYQSQ